MINPETHQQYKMNLLKPEDEYYPHWQEYHRQWKQMQVAIALWVVLGIFFILTCITTQWHPCLILPIFSVPGFFIFRAATFHRRWRCPRCYGYFHVKEMFDNYPWRKKCAHCGLPLYAPNDWA